MVDGSSAKTALPGVVGADPPISKIPSGGLLFHCVSVIASNGKFSVAENFIPSQVRGGSNFVIRVSLRTLVFNHDLPEFQRLPVWI